jgi:hypothetical protein
MTVQIRNEELGIPTLPPVPRGGGREFLIPNSYFLIQDAGSRS